MYPTQAAATRCPFAPFTGCLPRSDILRTGQPPNRAGNETASRPSNPLGGCGMRIVALAVVIAASWPSAAQCATIYIASPSSGNTTAAESDALTSSIRSATNVANLYGFAAIQLKAGFDPSRPLDLCMQAIDIARPQAKQQGISTPTPSPTTSPSMPKQTALQDVAPADVQSDAALQPGDLIIVLSLTRADQSVNQYTGIYRNDVLLNVTQLNCPKPKSTQQRGPFATPQGGVISQAWVAGTSGASADNYVANPLAGLNSIAGLLTSPWINRYRLWLGVPSTFLDSFKHEKKSLDGTIYCATTQAMLDMMFQNEAIKITADGRAFRHDGDQWRRVRGVNYCRAPQPVPPTLSDSATE